MRVLCMEPSRLAMATVSPDLSVPLKTRPMPRRPEVVAVIEVGDQHLQYAVRIAHRRRDVLEDGVEQRAQIGGRVLHAGACAMPVLAMV